MLETVSALIQISLPRQSLDFVHNKKGHSVPIRFSINAVLTGFTFSAPIRSRVQSTILHGESCAFLSSRTFINSHPFWFSRYSVHSFAPLLTSLQLPPCHNCKGHWIASRPTSKVSSGYPFFLVVSREKLCLGYVSLAVRMFPLITTCLSKKVLKKEIIEERRTKEGTNKRMDLAKWSSLENQGLWPNLTTAYDRMYWSGYFNLRNRFRRYVYTFWENCGWTSSEVV